MPRRRSPQEKKQLSYQRDGRNSYRANDKASRRAIPLGKARARRRNRHHVRQSLHDATGGPVPEVAERAEQRAAGRRPAHFRKWPDEPLREHVEFALAQRESV
jgi:hypothetical protein